MINPCLTKNSQTSLERSLVYDTTIETTHTYVYIIHHAEHTCVNVHVCRQLLRRRTLILQATLMASCMQNPLKHMCVKTTYFCEKQRPRKGQNQTQARKPSCSPTTPRPTCLSSCLLLLTMLNIHHVLLATAAAVSTFSVSSGEEQWVTPPGFPDGHNGGFQERLIQPAGNSKPHLVFILFDDYGWADAGWHRNYSIGGVTVPPTNEVQTPTLNDMVQNGINLNRHYVLILMQKNIYIHLCCTA